ncbi:MAG: hypothetical protein J6Y64_09240 [Ruminococcus sp.]|nr:hypothetical protein [Ruminococcus sp.]
MKSFNDYTGAEGIDKLVECSPYVAELLTDSDILSKMGDMSWIELGGAMYKAHSEACDKLFEILDHKPDNSLGLVSATAQVMAEIFSNKDMIDFFVSASKSAKSSTSAMENTEDGQ